MQRACLLTALPLLIPGPALHAAEKPAIIRSVKSGPWSDAKTWEGGKIPSAGVQVLIRPTHTVSYDVQSRAVIRSLHIGGVLSFAHDRDTRLEVGLIRIHAGEKIEEEGFDFNHPGKLASKLVNDPGLAVTCTCCDGKPALLVGTQERPIYARHTALIRLHYIPGMDRESCPAIVCCGGRMDFHGVPLSRTWVKLGQTARSGAREIVLAEPVTGWKAGDRIIVTATVPYGRGNGQTEERTIRKIDRTRLVLDAPLDYYHTGEGEFRGEVANLSRNVIVESADPKGVRGHTMYHARSAGSISYAEFRHLGKQGKLGRYSLHYHLCGDTMRGSSVVGASIWDSHNRWLTIHGTQYLVVRDCVGYKSVGHGFFLEDGTETYNVLDRNLAVLAREGKPLPEQLLPFDKNDGAGFWWTNSHNTFTRNVAADCDGYGFRYEATPRAGFGKGDQTFGSPRRFFSLTMPIRQPDGSRARVDVRTLSFVRFDDNETHNIRSYGLNMGQDAGDVGPDSRHPFVIRNMKIWSVQRGYTVHVPNVRIDGMRIHQAGYEIYRARYRAEDYRNVRLTSIRGSANVSTLADYLASGKVIGKPGVGLNRARLPGFPRGDGAGGSSYNPSNYEVARLEPVDDLPPITVITHLRREGKNLLVRGTTSDNGDLKRVLVNGREARLLAGKAGEWEVSLTGVEPGPLTLTAHAEDVAGNVERTRHAVSVRIR